MNDYSSSSATWQSSAAVELANSAIDNARRAAATSRSKHMSASASSPLMDTGYDPSSISTDKPKGMNTLGSNMDLIYNDNAFSVIATLVTARLIPKIHVSPNSSHYTVTDEDVAFFQKMLPSSVRQSFVDALRYRLQLLKSGVGSQDSAVGKLTMQCQFLGLDREIMNLLLVLDQSSGVKFPINYNAQRAADATSAKDQPFSPNHDQYFNHDTRQDNNTSNSERGDNVSNLRKFPINYNAQRAADATSAKDQPFSPNHDQYFNHDTRQDYNTSSSERGENGVNFGLKTPLEFTPNNTFTSPDTTFSPRNDNTTFSPRSNANTFSHRNSSNTLSPRNSINKFPLRDNSEFSPLNSTFYPRNNININTNHHNHNNSSNTLNSSIRTSNKNYSIAERSNDWDTTTDTFLPRNKRSTLNSSTRTPDQNSSNTTKSNDWENTTESLARRQLIAEINETKFLMRDSVTPDAVIFWKKHLEELEQRLVALSLEEQLKAAGSTDVPNSKVNICSQLPDMDVPNSKVNNICTQLPDLLSKEDTFNIGGDSVGWICQPSSPGDHHSVRADSRNVEITPYTPRNEMPEREPVCDVVAPSDLPGGYMFEAQIGSKKFLATVPPGGVIKNQIFTSTVRELESIEIPVPLGAWRDGAMDCFTDGVFHSLFLNALFVPCIALGQIMTRTGLDWRGRPANKLVSSFSCMNMTVLLMFWLTMNVSACFMMRFAWEQGRTLGVEYYGPIVLFDVFVLLYMVYLTKTVRGSIRNKYQIPEETFGRLQDCMCATFCMPCTICQMGRHTADYDTYRASCCSSTGLPRHVDLAPVTFYEDQYQTMNDGGHII